MLKNLRNNSKLNIIKIKMQENNKENAMSVEEDDWCINNESLTEDEEEKNDKKEKTMTDSIEETIKTIIPECYFIILILNISNLNLKQYFKIN